MLRALLAPAHLCQKEPWHLFSLLKDKEQSPEPGDYEEREAIIELRVQLRLLQRAKSEQQVQEEEDPEKRVAVSQQQQRDTVLETKAAKEQPKASKEQQVKPSPSKDRKETPIWSSSLDMRETNWTVQITVIWVKLHKWALLAVYIL